VAFLLFAVVAAVTPGPSNIMLTAAGSGPGS
jgi:threonine/homoserine/homoserine lactone efflux protein